MCNRLVNAVREMDVRPPGRKFVLWVLADAVNGQDDEPVCWPSQAFLAKACGMSDRAVRKHLIALQQGGQITRVGSRNGCTLYRINPEPRFQVSKSSAPEPGFHPIRNHSSGQSGTTVPTNQKEPEQQNMIVLTDNSEPAPKRADPQPCEMAFRNWNKAAEILKLPMAAKLTPERRRQLHARLREHGLDGFNDMLEKMADSEFLLGKNGRGWTVNFDWVIRPRNFNKIIDGVYAQEAGTDG